MTHPNHPPAGWYRVVVVLNGVPTNLEHNLGGHRAFDLVEEARTHGLESFWVSQASKHPFTCANTCPQRAAGLRNWRRQHPGKLAEPRVK